MKMHIFPEQFGLLLPLLTREDRTKELEDWVYSTKDLKMQLGANDYLELISIDFRESSARFFAEKIFRKHISADQFLNWSLSKMLERITKRADHVDDDLREIYYLYCTGYSFLQKLAMDFGITIVAPPPSYGEWEDLSDADQAILLDGLYPEVVEHAKNALNSLALGKIAFSGNTVDSLFGPLPGDPTFLDKRTESEKKAMSVKVLNLDNHLSE